MCGYCDLVVLAQNIVEFLVLFGIMVATLSIVYAGFLYVTALSSAAQVTKAHNVFRVAIVGLIVVLAAWLIINLLLTTFGVDTSIIGAEEWTLPGCE
jgi:hypothetical protein